jgi:hypothetical protein
MDAAIEALESRLATLKRRGWNDEERKLLSGTADDAEREIDAVRRRIRAIRKLRDGG